MRCATNALVRRARLRYAPVMSLIASLLLLSAQATPLPEALPSEIHNFDDWVVTCDNGLRCEAVSLVPANPPAPEEGAASEADPWDRFGVLKLARGPEADAPLVITLSDFDGVPARLDHYANTLDVTLVAQDEEGSWRVDAADRNALLERFFSGSLVVRDASGRALTEISVDGAWGAMVYMDERQGRLRTPTALLRRGTRPVSSIPAPPPVPVVNVAPRTGDKPLTISERRMNEARRQFGCTLEEVGVISQDVSTHALGNGRTLILMGCGAGAYNFSSLPLIAWREGNATRIEPAAFDVAREIFEGEEEPPGYFVINAEFDPATMTISEWSKGRGLGDCGKAAGYAWDGSRFRLVRQAEMSECRGTYELLTTWRTETR